MASGTTTAMARASDIHHCEPSVQLQVISRPPPPLVVGVGQRVDKPRRECWESVDVVEGAVGHDGAAMPDLCPRLLVPGLGRARDRAQRKNARVDGMPATRYVRTADGVYIAYQVFGDGPVDILHCGVSWWHLEHQWTEPLWQRFLLRLGSFARVILFDKRGAGLSDRLAPDELPSIGERLSDLTAVLDAVDSTSAVLYGANYGAQLAILYAATHADRTRALIAEDAMARLVRTDDYQWGITPEQAERALVRTEQRWADPVNFELVAPSKVDDPDARDWWLTMQRLSASPTSAARILRTAFETDVRDVLPAVRCPTLVIHHRDSLLIEVGHGRYLAEHIAGAKLLEVAGSDLFFVSRDDVADAVEEFITGHPPAGRPERMLSTVLFTDLVDSTGQLAAAGDDVWRTTLDRHDALVARTLERHGGQQVNTTGDGVLAVFANPSSAVRCARAICDGVTALGLQARAGVHVGEVERRGNDVTGLTVHIAARVVALAGAGEVLVTRTVTELAAGAGIAFEHRGDHELKGVPGMWSLLSVGS